MKNLSQDYYLELLKFANQIATKLRKQLAGVVFKNFLQPPDKLNLECYKKMYVENIGKSTVPERKEIQKIISGLGNLCEECIPFFLEKRSELAKNEDIITGTRFEEPFREFLRSKEIDAFDAGKIDMRLPDIGIKDTSNNVVALLEVKYHNAPFIKAREFVSSDTECYDGSLTIDVKKCKNQLKIANRLYPDAQKFIVHWVDFPCLKCILWDKLESVSRDVVYERIHRSGDYEGGRKVGYTEKTYHFVRYLEDFDSLIRTIKALSK